MRGMGRSPARLSYDGEQKGAFYILLSTGVSTGAITSAFPWLSNKGKSKLRCNVLITSLLVVTPACPREVDLLKSAKSIKFYKIW